MDGVDPHYIRRFANKSAVKKDRLVTPLAFTPRTDETYLSFTLRNDELQTRDQLLAYQLQNELPSGDRPGLCSLSHSNLTRDLVPPLVPVLSPDMDDPTYGHLHHATDLPTLVQREQMATQATQNGILLPAWIRGREHPP